MAVGNKFKYHRRVFSGKAVPMIGMDQGKSLVYRGDSVQQVWNALYDTSMKQRDGETVDTTYFGGVNTGEALLTVIVIGSGTDLRVEER